MKEDIRTLLEGESEKKIDALCEMVVTRFKEVNIKKFIRKRGKR